MSISSVDRHFCLPSSSCTYTDPVACCPTCGASPYASSNACRAPSSCETAYCHRTPPANSKQLISNLLRHTSIPSSAATHHRILAHRSAAGKPRTRLLTSLLLALHVSSVCLFLVVSVRCVGLEGDGLGRVTRSLSAHAGRHGEDFARVRHGRGCECGGATGERSTGRAHEQSAGGARRVATWGREE